MRDRDLTLIIDLIDGRLPPEEEKAALAVIAADPELRSAYRVQAAIVGELSATPSPSMTPSEREVLHPELKAQLHLDESPVVVPSPHSRWNRWLAPLAGLAVGAAVIVGAVVVLPGTLSGDADEAIVAAPATTTTSAASTQMADTTVAAFEAAPEAPVEAGEEDEQSDVVAGGTYNEASGIPFVADVDLSELADSYGAGSHLFDETAGKRSDGEFPVNDALVGACVDRVSSEATSSTVVPLLTTVYEGVPSMIVAVSPPAGDDYLVVYSLEACEEIATTRP